MITQDQDETFRDNINTLIQEYRNKFSLQVITDSKKYEETYRKRLLGMSREIRSMIDHVSGIHHPSKGDNEAQQQEDDL